VETPCLICEQAKKRRLLEANLNVGNVEIFGFEIQPMSFKDLGLFNGFEMQ